jgi:hypothetical protein
MLGISEKMLQTMAENGTGFIIKLSGRIFF